MYRVYFLSFIFFGCSSTLPDESLSLAEHLKIGMDYLEEEKYVKALDEFKFVLSITSYVSFDFTTLLSILSNLIFINHLFFSYDL